MRKDLVVLVVFQNAVMASVHAGVFPSILTTLRQDFSLTNREVAELVALYDVFQIWGSLGACRMSQSVGYVRSFAVSAVFSLVGAGVYCISSSFAALVIAEVSLGIGSSGVVVLTPPFLMLLARSNHGGGFLVGLSYAACSVGVVVAYVAVFLFSASNWRCVFASLALLFGLCAKNIPRS